MLDFFFEDVDALVLSNEDYTSWLTDVCEQEGKVLSEVSIVFCSDEYLLKMNIEYLDHDYYTDIITFDYCEDDLIIGDLFVSVDRVQENAKDNNVTFINELNRVMAHGVLHLLGYKDKTSEDQETMTFKENWALGLNVPRET